MSQCWSCHLESFEADFCSNCGKIQPVIESTDYFKFLGLKELLDLNLDELEEKFYSLSRKFHPDFYLNGSKEERAISLEKAALLNKAYKTLKDPYSRANYILELLWSDKKDDEKNNVPPELLMEVMELHEIIDTMTNETDPDKKARLAEAVNEIRNELKKKSEAFEKKLNDVFQRWDTTVERLDGRKLLCVEHQLLLEEMNKILVVRSYLETLQNSIKTKLPVEL